jgi:uncharacterized protein YrrD
MLWNIKELSGYNVKATDGEVGKVHDIIFDKRDWAIHFLIVDLGDWVLDTGDWIPGRQVLVSSTAFGQPNKAIRLFPVTLTKGGVEHNPGVEIIRQDGSDPRFYSMKSILGRHIQANDGEIGYAEDIIIDDERWKVHFIVVNTGNWWPGKKVLVAPIWISLIALDEPRIYTKLTQETIQNSPEFNTSTMLDRSLMLQRDPGNL